MRSVFVLFRGRAGVPSAALAVLVLSAPAWLAFGRAAGAHTLGLSMADFEVGDHGAVDARLTFASAEPLGGLSLDRDHDGVVTPADVASARDDLATFVLQGVEVAADGSPCPGVFRGASLSETDGLVLESSYECPDDATEIEATLYYLSALPRGHREVARILSGSRTVAEVLTGDRRALALRVGREGGRKAHGALRKGWPVVAMFGAIAAGVLGGAAWVAWRWRATRAAWQNRGP